jgi:hypothetical protein
VITFNNCRNAITTSRRNLRDRRVTLTLPNGSVIPSGEDGNPAELGRIGVWRSASAGTSLFFGTNKNETRVSLKVENASK